MHEPPTRIRHASPPAAPVPLPRRDLPRPPTGRTTPAGPSRRATRRSNRSRPPTSARSPSPGPTTPATPSRAPRCSASRWWRTASSTRARPKLRVFALDAATGAPRWSFDPFEGTKTSRWTRIRGLMYWERGDERRIYFGARHWLYALDANDRQADRELRRERPRRPAPRLRGPRPGRGQHPRQHARSLLRRPADPRLGRPRGAALGARATSAPSTCTRGRQQWAFHTIPHPGELGYDTWPKDAWKYIGGANAWSGLSLDVEARPRLRRDRLGGLRLLRREPSAATTCSRTRSCA